jgi:hypothetical protein
MSDAEFLLLTLGVPVLLAGGIALLVMIIRWLAGRG